METKVISSRMNENKVLNLVAALSDELTRLEVHFGSYEAEDRRAQQVNIIHKALTSAIEAAAMLYAYEVESRVFVEADNNEGNA